MLDLTFAPKHKLKNAIQRYSDIVNHNNSYNCVAAKFLLLNNLFSSGSKPYCISINVIPVELLQIELEYF